MPPRLLPLAEIVKGLEGKKRKIFTHSKDLQQGTLFSATYGTCIFTAGYVLFTAMISFAVSFPFEFKVLSFSCELYS